MNRSRTEKNGPFNSMSNIHSVDRMNYKNNNHIINDHKEADCGYISVSRCLHKTPTYKVVVCNAHFNYSQSLTGSWCCKLVQK